MHIDKKGGIYSVLVLGSGNVIGTLISAVAIIILTRQLGPMEFGIFSGAFAAMQIFVRLADLGINTAAERFIARGNHHNTGLMQFVLWFKILLFVILFGAGYLASPYLATHVLGVADPTLLRLTFALSLGTIMFEYGNIIYQATHRFGLVARMTIVQALGKLVATIFMLSMSSLSAVTGLVIYGVMPLLGFLSTAGSLPKNILSRQIAWREYTPQLLSVAKWTGIATLSATLADNIDTLIVQSFLDNYQTGLWGGATRIAAFTSIFGWSMGTVLSNRVARYHDSSHLKDYLAKSWKISLGSFLILLLALPFASLAVTYTIGEAYLSVVPVLQVLMISSALSAANSPFSSLFYLFDRPQYYAITGVLQTTILLVGDFLIIPSYGLMGAAQVRVAVKLIVLLFTLLYARASYQKMYAKA